MKQKRAAGTVNLHVPAAVAAAYWHADCSCSGFGSYNHGSVRVRRQLFRHWSVFSTDEWKHGSWLFGKELQYYADDLKKPGSRHRGHQFLGKAALVSTSVPPRRPRNR
jgi:hypothetical protein